MSKTTRNKKTITAFRIIPNFSQYEMNEERVVRDVLTKEVRPMATADGAPKVNLKNDEGKWRRPTLTRLYGITFPPNLSNFKPKINYPEYLINGKGEIWSKSRHIFLKWNENDYGHQVLQLSGPIPITIYQHQIVWEYYHNETTEGFDIDHIDDNPRNNDIGNLNKCTRSQNIMKSSLRDRLPKGERHHKTKLTNAFVMEIKYLIEHTTLRNMDIAPFYGVAQAVISDIRRGITWKHIEVLKKGEVNLSRLSIVRSKKITKSNLMKRFK